MPFDSQLVSTFVGERYAGLDRLDAVIAPPYDVIGPDERDALAARHEHNIVSLILPAGDGDRYEQARALLQRWREAGVFVRDAGPSVYVVRQRFTTPDGRSHTRTGVIGAVAAEPYEAGRVKPHERTHKGPKVDRLSLMRSTRAMFEALLMLAPDRDRELLDRAVAASSTSPHAVGALDGGEVSLWVVSGPEGEGLAAAASKAGALYIADGHHRFETANAYRGENPAAERTLALIVPAEDPGLVVLPTHRVLAGARIELADIQPLVEGTFEAVDLSDLDEPERELEELGTHGTACIVVTAGGQATGFVLRESAWATVSEPAEESVRALDIARIDTLMVEPLLTAGPAVTRSYTPDGAAAVRSVRDGKASAAILVNPTSVDQVLAVADAGAFMPQKSTYFAPKVPSGLVLLSWQEAAGR